METSDGGQVTVQLAKVRFVPLVCILGMHQSHDNFVPGMSVVACVAP